MITNEEFFARAESALVDLHDSVEPYESLTLDEWLAMLSRQVERAFDEAA